MNGQSNQDNTNAADIKEIHKRIISTEKHIISVEAAVKSVAESQKETARSVQRVADTVAEFAEITIRLETNRECQEKRYAEDKKISYNRFSFIDNEINRIDDKLEGLVLQAHEIQIQQTDNTRTIKVWRQAIPLIIAAMVTGGLFVLAVQEWAVQKPVIEAIKGAEASVERSKKP